MLDPASWAPSRARIVSLLVLGAVALLALGALLAWTLAPESIAPIAWGLLLPIVLLLVLEAVVLARAPSPARPGSAPMPPPAPAPASSTAEEAPVLRETLLTLRCSHCGTVFEVSDTGERPLRHVCPGCGTEGVVA